MQPVHLSRYKLAGEMNVMMKEAWLKSLYSNVLKVTRCAIKIIHSFIARRIFKIDSSFVGMTGKRLSNSRLAH
jgi:hypothetical protein